MSEKRFFTKINNKGKLVIIDKECHTELFDMTLTCDVLNRLDLKLKHYNEVNGEQQATIDKLQRYNDVLHNENLFNTMKMLEFMKEKGVFDEFYERIKKEVFGDE